MPRNGKSLLRQTTFQGEATCCSPPTDRVDASSRAARTTGSRCASWSPDDDALAVTVDEASGESFELVVEPAEALDVFEHPYAYAAFRCCLAHAGLAA